MSEILRWKSQVSSAAHEFLVFKLGVFFVVTYVKRV